MFLPLLGFVLWLSHQNEQAEKERLELADYYHDADDQEDAAGIYGVTYKSRFIPIYKNLAVKELGWKSETNIKWAQNRSGVYQIKENGVLVYIGASANVYRKSLRHFEPYEGQNNKKDYHKYLDTKEFTIRITLTNTPHQAYLLESALIAKHQPRDNYIQPSLFYTKEQRAAAILADYEEMGVMKLEDVPF